MPVGTRTLVVGGPSGSGKSTVAGLVAGSLGWDLADADDFHPPANVERMRAGVALTDDDRLPWLAALAAWVGRHEAAGTDAVLACSVLRRTHRDLLRDGHPSVWFAQLDVPRDELARRLAARTGHWMSPGLLDSQLEAFEPLGADEPGRTLPGAGPPETVAAAVLAAVLATVRR